MFGITSWTERASLVEEKLTFTSRSSRSARKLLFGSLPVAPTASFAANGRLRMLEQARFWELELSLIIIIVIELMFLGVNMFLASIIWIVTSSTNGFICSEWTAGDVRASSFLEARAILDYYNSNRVDVLGRKYVFGKHYLDRYQ